MVIMKSSHCSEVVLKILLFLVVSLGSEVRGQLCPPGQVTHQDQGQTRCCLPVDCGPNHFLKFCSQNGTEDTCEQCPRNRALFKRTSSFAMEPCHLFPLDPKPTCAQPPGNPIATEEDRKNCFCDLEKGEYYLKPQVPLGMTSYCQPFRFGCSAGKQPTQQGVCEPCPRNTVQDIDDAFRLCRPQRNCTAMRLETEEVGNAQKETVCAKPPPPPSHPPSVSTRPTSTPVAPVTKGKTTAAPPVVVPPHGDDVSVAPSLNGTAGGDNTTLMIVLAVVLLLVLVVLTICFVMGQRKGWFRGLGRCGRHDEERHSYPGTQMQMSSHDNDNASDNSCCACADSCLTSSSKSSSSAAGRSGASTSAQTKNPGPVPMLEAYMNRNGNCPQVLQANGSLLEPLYNSISHDGSKLSDGNMATYKNVNGVPPTVLGQEDFYNYPNKVCLTPSDEEEEDESMKKDAEAKLQQRSGKGKDSEDFTETDPLLPNSEHISGVPTPVSTPGLRGILRNGPNRQQPPVRGGGQGQVMVGNRPHLSMLLSASEESSHSSAGGAQTQNLPYLSQLMSNPHSQQPCPPQQQELQQQAPEVQQHVHELPQQLQQLLQQQQLQQQQDGSTLAARLAPTVPVLSTAQPQLNPSLVQMEELKPVMPHCPSPAGAAPLPPSGATNLADDKGRAGSPARISPSQQEEVRGGCGREAHATPKAQPADIPVGSSPATVRKGAAPEKNMDEQTLRKQAMLAASPQGDEDETTHKSVGGSSGLGDSLDISSPLSMPSDEGRRSRTLYRRSVSEVSRSVSPSLPLPPSRSISSPEEKHRPFAVVKPMQSDQSLNTMSCSQDRLTELSQPLEVAGRQFPLHSLRGHTPRRQSSQDSSDDPDQTRPKTPDRLSEDENEEIDSENQGAQEDSDERTRASFFGDNDGAGPEEGGKDKPAPGSGEG